MGLQESMMMFVSNMMAWVIQTENGGLLNILFQKTQTALTNELKFNVNLDLKPVINFFATMCLMKPVPLPILEVMPESLGGGQAGVNHAHAHPNMEGHIFWITISIFLAALVFILFILLINCVSSKRKASVSLSLTP